MPLESMGLASREGGKNASNYRCRDEPGLVFDSLPESVGQPFQAADPHSCGSSRPKARCRQAAGRIPAPHLLSNIMRDGPLENTKAQAGPTRKVADLHGGGGG